jgi:hypothetical protein
MIFLQKEWIQEQKKIDKNEQYLKRKENKNNMSLIYTEINIYEIL